MAQSKSGHSIITVAAASFMGTAIEWYDFFLYGTASALVFNKLFFPDVDPLVGTMYAYLTFAAGFLARPIGGIVFGHYGDRIGRKRMLYLTLLIMGIGTFCVGLLPGYSSLGALAPGLLLLLRLLQGFGLGGEWGGAVLMAVEHAPDNKRGFYGSWPQTGAAVGLFLSTVVFSLFSGLPEDQFVSWGWRVPFLLSFVLVVVGLFIRSSIAESPVFERVKDEHAEARIPALDALRTHPKQILVAMGARFAENGLFYIFATFVLSYATTAVGLPRSYALNGVLIAAALDVVFMPAFGALSDRLGRRPVYLGGAIFAGIMAVPFFLLINSGQQLLVILAVILGFLGHAAMYGPQASFFSELFGTRVRYSGASIGYQLASVFAGGFSPLIATVLLAYGVGFWPVAVYMLVLVVITLVSVLAASETFRGGLTQQAPADAPTLTLTQAPAKT
jgi:MFS transporter, MHS family, shikimate and dehydroshikimate transport protein